MQGTAALQWWQDSLSEAGVQAMDKLLSPDATWDEVLATGDADCSRALALTGMRTGRDRVAVEVGCGVGRMTAALAEHFGCVVGLDVAPALLNEARTRNVHAHVQFELTDGATIRPQIITAADTVFSYEVFYYIEPTVLAGYFHDIHQLLRPGGELVFQLNLEPIRWTTRLSSLLRDALHRIGVREFRGWPTGPGFRRHAYDLDGVCRALARCGFESISVSGPHLRETWFVARKPQR